MCCSIALGTLYFDAHVKADVSKSGSCTFDTNSRISNLVTIGAMKRGVRPDLEASNTMQDESFGDLFTRRMLKLGESSSLRRPYDEVHAGPSQRPNSNGTAWILHGLFLFLFDEATRNVNLPMQRHGGFINGVY